MTQIVYVPFHHFRIDPNSFLPINQKGKNYFFSLEKLLLQLVQQCFGPALAEAGSTEDHLDEL